MNAYFSLLNDRKITEAEEYRKSLVPNKLLKFVSLSDNIESNNKNFYPYKTNKLGFRLSIFSTIRMNLNVCTLTKKDLNNMGIPTRSLPSSKNFYMTI